MATTRSATATRAAHIRQQQHFWGAITPAEYDSISDFVRSDSTTYTQQANLTVTNTDLFSLPAGLSRLRRRARSR